MKVDLYNKEGKKTGKKVDLPEEVFGLKVNPDLVYQVIRAQQMRRRQNTAHTKERGEVRGGGRKPWRQKGTGRARHGSIRSPIWKGGGVTFGPRKERNYKKKINKKAKRKALSMVLSAKRENGMMIFITDLDIKEPKTNEMRNLLERMPCEGSTLILLPQVDRNIILSARNIEKVDTMQVSDVNPLDLMSYKNIIVPKESLEIMKKNLASNSETEKEKVTQ